MRKVEGYQLLHHTSCWELQRLVQDSIINGYQPLGMPFTYLEVTGDYPQQRFCQAVIKLEDKKPMLTPGEIKKIAYEGSQLFIEHLQEHYPDIWAGALPDSKLLLRQNISMILQSLFRQVMIEETAKAEIRKEETHGE